MKLFTSILLLIDGILILLINGERNKIVKDYNSLLKKYNEQNKELEYYKNLFNETLKHKRALEQFINSKINPNIQDEQNRQI